MGAKLLLLGFYVTSAGLEFGYTMAESELQCEIAVQAVEDGQRIHLTREDGTKSPPLIYAFCVDADREAYLE